MFMIIWEKCIYTIHVHVYVYMKKAVYSCICCEGVISRSLQEDVMSKTQQVKQYKKQIDQLGTEVATYREQAEVHKSQVRGSVYV